MFTSGRATSQPLCFFGGRGRPLEPTWSDQNLTEWTGVLGTKRAR